MTDKGSKSAPGKIPAPIVPLEPLYSMLQDAPLDAVEYLHQELSRENQQGDLDETLPSLGISRRRAIEQTRLVLEQRRDR